MLEKLKRYEMEHNYNQYCMEDQVNEVEDKDGRWVQFKDLEPLAQLGDICFYCDKNATCSNSCYSEEFVGKKVILI